MYAVIEVGGHQYKVAQNDVIFVNRLIADVDETLEIDRVLLVSDNKNTKIGTPTVDGAKVTAKVLEHSKGEKLVVFKKKRRKGYQKRTGHRQLLTQLKIETVKA